MRRFRDCFSGQESEAELLESWRMYDFGGWAKEYKVNPRWIKDGQTSNKDYHSWLRDAQLQGREVCVVGATKNICRVCVEAWNTGFKPVLVLLQDLIDEDIKENLLRAASRLQACRYRSGVLHTAFEVLVVDSHQVSLKLDVDGQPMDVNVAAPHFCYPFQGPAIVLGNILRHDMLEDVHEKSLEAYHTRINDECAVVLDPRFWEQRRDPECVPYTIMTYWTFVSVCLVNLFQTMANVAVYKFHDDEYFGVIRPFVGFLYSYPACHAVGITFCSYLGLEIPRGRFTPFSILISWIFEIPGLALMPFKVDGHLIVSDFMSGFAGILATVFAMLFYAKYIVKARITKWATLWYLVALFGTVGGWATSVPILMIYQVLLATNGFVASVYLTVAFTGMEAAFVKFMSFFYANLVARKRKDDPTSIPGDQKWSLAVTVYSVHAYTETARLASLMSGAIAADDVSFLRNAVISLISSTALNTAVRTAAVSRLTIRMPIIGNFLCPTALWAVHNNSKFTMGWGRFFSVAGVMLGRGLIHGQWEISLTPKPGLYNTWCWSGIVLITVCLSYLSEVLEDLLVFCLTRSGYPYPNSRRYEEIMSRRLQDPSTSTRQHVCHYAIPQMVDSPKYEDEVVNRVGPPPSLTNQRVVDTSVAFMFPVAISIILMIDLSMGVGSGNLMGFCRPLDIKQDSFLTILQNAVFWDMQCKF